MNRHKHSPVRRAVLISLAGCLILETVFVSAQTRPNYNPGIVSSNPIGLIRSINQVKINGRVADGEQFIWNGDVIESGSSEVSQVLIDSAGQLSLSSKVKVRLSAKMSNLDYKTVLVASLLSGKLAVKLNRDANAYIEAGGYTFTSSDGAVFCISIKDGNPVVESERGEVKSARKYFEIEFTARPVVMDVRTRRERGRASNKVKESRRKSVLLNLAISQREKPKGRNNVRVLSQVGSFSTSQANIDWKPAVGKKVLFRLTNPIGTLDGRPDQVVVDSNQFGIASVTFVGEIKGDTRVIARVMTEPGETCEPEEVFWDITVTDGPGLFRVRNLIIFGAVAVIATYPVWKPKGDRNIEIIPPPVFVP